MYFYYYFDFISMAPSAMVSSKELSNAINTKKDKLIDEPSRKTSIILDAISHGPVKLPGMR